ncbi:sialate O-acetylesterase [Levilactobacillus namurensis]|uniref:sialate O-acetylesterase n=1 Tax=Levilactobacillus namurensis TaxID=380393 RepID=UPI00222E5683|nr:sialate O-acetylesterase [Levilactobacillus namurensis]MCW3778547.1 sialate O-acetylesterase [Levilactobacillus namurensis]MDT7019532.1 sialate O-acetylesterase [Levilactobacillus namurensis]WNN65878.1 sialate O-acetylesterase [Levilactobacillus namurensis]
MSLKLPAIFQDGMVLQRDAPIRIWGDVTPNSILEVGIDEETPKMAGVSNDGSFTVYLSEHAAQKDGTLKFIVNGTCVQKIKISIGEVWLLAGQSNMDFNLVNDGQYQESAKKVLELLDQSEKISFFKVPQKITPDSEADQTGEPGKWHSLNHDNAAMFSAIGYYFGLKLSKLLSHVPVGLVWMTYGGTTASTWTSKEALEDDPVLKKTYLDSYNQLLSTRPAGEYEAFLKMVAAQSSRPEVGPFWDNVVAGRVDHETLSNAYKEHHELFVDYVLGPQSENRPHGLFDTMVKTIIGYRFKACLWYQGESDDQHAEVYNHLLTAMIKDWWHRWDYHFPVLVMQLAPFEEWFGVFDGTFYPELRRQQGRVADALPGVYLTNVLDDGMQYDIHPKNKQLAAERFYLLALDKVYHQQEHGQAPKVISTEFVDHTIQLKFNECQQLQCQKLQLENVMKLTVNGVAMPVTDVKVNDDKLIIGLSQSITPDKVLEISYQNQPFSHAALFNEHQIPVRPFDVTVSA